MLRFLYVRDPNNDLKTAYRVGVQQTACFIFCHVEVLENMTTGEI